MTKKVISYKLNRDGTIPDYVEDGGYLVKDEGDSLSMVLIGISKPRADISGCQQEFDTQESLISYINTYLYDHTYIDSRDYEINFIIADEVSRIFSKKDEI